MTLFEYSGKNPRLISTVLLFVVFIAGALAGAAGERVLRADDAPQRTRSTEMRGGTRRLLQDEQFAWRSPILWTAWGKRPERPV